ncbi:MAG: methionine adenosyltransferase [Roseinatronobacter sp.]
MYFQTGLFTSESVSEGHPDKICDQISDAILDACLAQDLHARVAIEVAIKGDLLCILGELTTTATIDPAAIARDVLRDIGHDDGRWGLVADQVRIITEISQQSPEIGAGVDALDREADLGAGDQGLMFGYACSETRAYMPLAISLAHDLMALHRDARLSANGQELGPDAKAQVTMRYRHGRPDGVAAVVLSSQHSHDLCLADLREKLRELLIAPVLGPHLRPDTQVHINPASSFHSGGPIADAGLTGRKIIVDTYGGMARHGGGAFSGKDGTKVDRSGAYAARQLARDVVARGWAEACEVRLAYAIGQPRPVAVDFETFGTGNGGDPATQYRQIGLDIADMMRPAAIIDRLQLRAPLFRQTAVLGHFGRAGMPWERFLSQTVDRSRFATGAAVGAAAVASRRPDGQASHISTYVPLRRNIHSKDIELWQQADGTFTLRYAGSTNWWGNPALPRDASGARRHFWHDHDSAVSYVDQVYGGFGGLRVVPVGSGT